VKNVKKRDKVKKCAKEKWCDCNVVAMNSRPLQILHECAKSVRGGFIVADFLLFLEKNL